MKKTFRFMAVIATVAAALASCAKAEMDAPANEDAAGENVYQGPTRLLTFEAQTGTPQTRTSLGDVVTDGQGNKTLPVLWEADDEIKILYVLDGTEYSVKVTPKSVDGSTAVFEAEVPETGVDTYYAVYPSSVTSTVTMKDGESGELKVAIPTTTGTFKNANIMVAKCAASAPLLNFKHACSIVKFTTGDVAPRDVFFYAGDRTYNRGYDYVNFDSDNTIASITTATSTDKYSSIDASEPNTDYYMALWPDHTLNDGFIIAFRSNKFINTEDGWRVAYYPQDITLARGEILDLGVIQDKIRTDYFVAANAKGKKDGSSWDNACDIAYVRNMFAKPADSDYAYAQQMKLENTNFWFAGDAAFVFGTDETPRIDMCFAAANKGNRCPINFYGGCTGTTGTDKTRDPENHPTVFSGNSKYAIFSVRNKTTLTLDGITLADARAVDAHDYDGLYGAALYVGFISIAAEGSIYQYGLTFADYAPQVHVNNCIFRDNVEGDAELDGNNGAGSAINLKAGQVYVNNSHFDGNKSYNRGCVHAAASTTAGTLLYFNACSFTGNSMSTNYGSVIRSLDIDTKVGLNGCSFIDNSCNGVANSPVNIVSPSVLTNNTIIEDASSFKSTSNVGIFRMQLSADGSETVLANNIVIDSSDKGKAAVYFGGAYAHTLNSQTNLLGVYNEANSTSHTLKDLTDGSTGMRSSKTGMKMSDFGSLTATSGNRYYTWDGNVTDFTYATAVQMVDATKANTLVGDSFYNWLVEIGAIVNNQFTDCRGYLRPADAMCPGAYDPFATAAE